MNSSAAEAIKNALDGVLDTVYKGFDFVSKPAIDAYENIMGFFELWDVVSDIPELLISYLWGPIGICVGCVVFVALVRLVLGWGNI